MRSGPLRWHVFGAALAIMLVSFSLSQAQVRILYSTSSWVKWLSRQPKAVLDTLWNRGYLEVQIVGGKAEYIAELPERKVWVKRYPEFAISDSSLLWLAGVDFVAVQDTDVVDPDTIVTESWQFGSPAKFRGRNVYVKSKLTHKIVIKGKHHGGKHKGWRLTKARRKQRLREMGVLHREQIKPKPKKNAGGMIRRR